MKFSVGDIIRHVNGVKEFVVYTADRIQGVYGLKEEGSPVVHSYAACHVDRMYRQPCWNEPSSSDPPSAWGQPGAFQNCVHEARFRLGGANAATPVTPASDVSVSLRGLPAGYYLKSFRKAEPGDLILNTSGAVVTAKITQNGMTLYRPIVGKVSSLNVLNSTLIPGLAEGWTVIAYRIPFDGEKYLTTVSGSDEVVTAVGAVNFKRLVVKPTPRLTSCDGTLPGIPKGYRLVGFGAVNEKQFYIDTVGNLKSGPAKHRLILEPLVDGPVKQPEVATEYEIECWGATVWAPISFYHFPPGENVRYTGRTRKVVVQ